MEASARLTFNNRQSHNRSMTTLEEVHVTNNEVGAALLHEHAQAVKDVIDHSHAENTHSTYSVGWRSWERFAATYGYTIFPSQPEAVAAWLVHLAEEGKSPATTVTYLQGVMDRHRQASIAVPLENSEGLRRTVRGLAREGRQHGAKKARALTATELMRLVGYASTDETPGGRRDVAWWLTCTSLGLRYSDAAALRRKHVRFVEGKGAVVTVPYSKTDQAAVGVDLPLLQLGVEWQHMDATRALSRLLAVLPDDEDTPLFQGAYKGRQAFRGSAASCQGLNQWFRDLADAAGVPSLGLSTHSARATFATGAYSAGIGEDAISRTGRWASLSIQRSYRRVSDDEMFSPDVNASDWFQRLLSQ